MMPPRHAKQQLNRSRAATRIYTKVSTFSSAELPMIKGLWQYLCDPSLHWEGCQCDWTASRCFPFLKDYGERYPWLKFPGWSGNVSENRAEKKERCCKCCFTVFSLISRLHGIPSSYNWCEFFSIYAKLFSIIPRCSVMLAEGGTWLGLGDTCMPIQTIFH